MVFINIFGLRWFMIFNCFCNVLTLRSSNSYLFLIQDNKATLTDREEFDEYRKQHPGPDLDNALKFWLNNGKKDRADFKWRAKKGKQMVGKSGKGGFKKGGSNGRAGKSRGKGGHKVNISLREEKGGIGIKGLL